MKSITFKPLAILIALTLCFSSVSVHVTAEAVAEQAERASSFEKGRYAMIVHDVLRAYPSLGERSTLALEYARRSEEQPTAPKTPTSQTSRPSRCSIPAMPPRPMRAISILRRAPSPGEA